MQPIQVLVLGPEGAGRTALEHTLARLGCSVSASEAHADRPTPAGSDILMLDVRGDESQWDGLAPGLHDDRRPVVIVSERPRPIVRELARRPAGTVLLTGAESDAGYRVALSVLRGLSGGSLGAAAGRDGDALTRLAAL
jgi:hypothetical protein